MGVLLVVNLKGRDKGNDLCRHDADVTAEISVLITVIKIYSMFKEQLNLHTYYS